MRPRLTYILAVFACVAFASSATTACKKKKPAELPPVGGEPTAEAGAEPRPDNADKADPDKANAEPPGPEPGRAAEPAPPVPPPPAPPPALTAEAADSAPLGAPPGTQPPRDPSQPAAPPSPEAARPTAEPPEPTAPPLPSAVMPPPAPAPTPPEAPRPSEPPPAPKRAPADRLLDVTGLLSLVDLERVLGKKQKFTHATLPGIQPSDIYNALYYEPAGKSGTFGVAVQVWKDRNLNDARTRYNTMKNTYADIADTTAVTEQGFRAHFGEVVTLVFADPRRPIVAGVSCSTKLCKAADLIELSKRTFDHLR